MKKIFFVLSIISISCFSQDVSIFSKDVIVIGYSEKPLEDAIMKSWQHKDIFKDTIPGVSTEIAYKEILSKKEGETTIVAIIDSGVDIDHEDLKSQIWINNKEILNNNKDDDNNGYIDDIHGWNFLGNNKGENIYYARNEYVRLLQEKGFLDNGEASLPENIKDSVLINAADFYKNAKKVLDEDIAYANEVYSKYDKIYTDLKTYFPDKKYSLEKLKTIDTIKNPDLKNSYKQLEEFLTYEMTLDWLKDFEKYNNIIRDYKLNPDYNDRLGVNDNQKFYGNNNVKGNPTIDVHGTVVAGVLGANRNNKLGIDGIADNLKLMVLRAVPSGDEYDRDIALAIRYASDNGAKVINMSFGKFFSPNSKLVLDAIKYAAKKDVLIVHAAGNDSENVDEVDFYPLDYKKKNEITKNYINVGALNYKLNRKLPAYFSNYGKRNVDVFAPGYNLYSTLPNNKYITESGTSIAAPIVSGIAALIRSRYPDLKASDVKNIILNSGNTYHLNVTIPGKRKSPKTRFSELSKSGKVVNAYNALLMAEQITKAKK